MRQVRLYSTNYLFKQFVQEEGHLDLYGYISATGGMNNFAVVLYFIPSEKSHFRPVPIDCLITPRNLRNWLEARERRSYEDTAEAIADDHRGFLEPQRQWLPFLEYATLNTLVVVSSRRALPQAAHAGAGAGTRREARGERTSLVCRSEIYWVGNDSITARQNGLRHFSA